MALFRLLIAAALVLGTCTLTAADKTAAKTAQPAAGKTADKGADKNKSEKATPVGDMPPSPPRLTYQGLKGQPGLANYENRQGKVPADKYDVVTKALADAKLPILVSLYSTLNTAHEAAVKADTETTTAEKDADRDKAKVDKLQAEVDKTKGNTRLRGEYNKANNQLKDAKDEAERTANTLKKRHEEAKTAHDAFAAAKAAYDKALADAQPAIDTFRKEANIPDAK
jgi:hypothetical protein